MLSEQKSKFLCNLKSLQCSLSPPSEHFLEYEGISNSAYTEGKYFHSSLQVCNYNQ